MVRVRVLYRRGRRIIRRRRHTDNIRIRNIVPIKPRKAPSAFNLFVRDYFRSAMARNFRTAPEAMTHAGIFWRSHPIQRQQYENRARPEQERFKATYSDYQKKRVLLKRPGNAFIYFVRDFWQREGRGKPISEIGKLAGTAWRRMTQEDRRPFQEQANQAQETYSRMIHEVKSGRARFEDYMRSPAQEAAAGDVTGENVQA